MLAMAWVTRGTFIGPTSTGCRTNPNGDFTTQASSVWGLGSWGRGIWFAFYVRHISWRWRRWGGCLRGGQGRGLGQCIPISIGTQVELLLLNKLMVLGLMMLLIVMMILGTVLLMVVLVLVVQRVHTLMMRQQPMMRIHGRICGRGEDHALDVLPHLKWEMKYYRTWTFVFVEIILDHKSVVKWHIAQLVGHLVRCFPRIPTEILGTLLVASIGLLFFSLIRYFPLKFHAASSNNEINGYSPST